MALLARDKQVLKTIANALEEDDHAIVCMIAYATAYGVKVEDTSKIYEIASDLLHAIADQ
jgi:hypothetical protein